MKQQHHPASRGVSEVIGAILVFGLVLMLLTLIQVMVVPSANQQIEVKHSQSAQQDVVGVNAALDRIASTGTSESVAVEVGMQYPSRMFLINPPAVRGSVSLEATDQPIGLRNARAVNEETADFWTGDSLDFETATMEYSSDYTYYDNSPTTVFEHGVLYNEFRERTPVAQIVLDDGDLLQGRQIRLLSLAGDTTESGTAAVSLEAVPLSAPMQKISVTNGSEPIEIRLPTQLSAKEWRSVLSDELCEDGDGNGRCDAREDGVGSTDPPGYITDLRVSNDGILTITLEKGVTYDLRMGKVGIGPSLPSEEAYYVTDVRGSGSSIQLGGSHDFVVQVRDRYNNPVSGVTVTFSMGSSDDGRFQNENEDGEVLVRTDESGYASAVFTPSREGSVTLEASAGDLGDDNSVANQAHEIVRFTGIQVGPGDGQEAGTDVNPHVSGGNLVLVDVEERTEGTKVVGFDATFQNTGTVDRSFTDMRYSFAFSSKSGGTEAPDAVTVSGGGISPTILEIGGRYGEVESDVVGPDGTITIQIEAVDSTKSFDSFMVLSTLVDAAGDEEKGLYFLDSAISNEPPVASFTYTPADPPQVNVGEPVTFNASASYDPEGSELTYEWDLDGDGDIDATGVEVTTSYDTAGDVDVTLTVTDPRGASDAETQTVKVRE